MPVNVAAHDREQTVILRGQGSATRIVNSGDGRQVMGVPLDQVLAGFHTGNIDVLKIDVQGHEEKALLGMNLMLAENRVELVILELHLGWGIRINEIESLMKSHGYRVVMKDSYLFGQPHLYFLVGNGSVDEPVPRQLASPYTAA